MENKRLIDANEVIKKSITVQAPRNGLNMLPGQQWMDTVSAIRVIDVISAPTVDAKEVVHGRWVWDVESHGDPMYGIDEDYGYRCSECQVWASEYGVDGDIYDEPPTHILHYCPSCGAKMDGDMHG